MKQKYMYVANALINKEDSVAGAVFVVLDGTAAEIDVWVDYEVLFMGPTNSSDKEFKIVTDGSAWTLNGSKITTLPDSLTDGYDVYFEASKDLSSYFNKIFGVFRTIDSINQSAVWMWHVLVDRFVTDALPALGSAAILHVSRRPFPQLLPAGSRLLPGGTTQGSSGNSSVDCACTAHSQGEVSVGRRDLRPQERQTTSPRPGGCPDSECSSLSFEVCPGSADVISDEVIHPAFHGRVGADVCYGGQAEAE